MSDKLSWGKYISDFSLEELYKLRESLLNDIQQNTNVICNPNIPINHKILFSLLLNENHQDLCKILHTINTREKLLEKWFRYDLLGNLTDDTKIKLNLY